MLGSKGCWSSCMLGLSMVVEALVEGPGDRRKQMQISKVLPSSSITPLPICLFILQIEKQILRIERGLPGSHRLFLAPGDQFWDSLLKTNKQNHLHTFRAREMAFKSRLLFQRAQVQFPTPTW